ncbi:MAG: hypothetical protein Q4D19_12535, partial [Lautropia sp.]|nr:hypothetical protein [Lautropia sp.]
MSDRMSDQVEQRAKVSDAEDASKAGSKPKDVAVADAPQGRDPQPAAPGVSAAGPKDVGAPAEGAAQPEGGASAATASPAGTGASNGAGASAAVADPKGSGAAKGDGESKDSGGASLHSNLPPTSDRVLLR